MTQKQIPAVNKDPLDYVREVSKSLLMKPVTEEYLCTIVSKMQFKRSSGLDGISNYIVKGIINTIKMPLCAVVNKSILSGEFPNGMKIAKVKPLLKSPPDDQADNYCPISLLPVLSKILERVAYKNLISHMDSNNILYSKQFGF